MKGTQLSSYAVNLAVGGEPPYRVYPIEAGVVPEDGEEPYRLR